MGRRDEDSSCGMGCWEQGLDVALCSLENVTAHGGDHEGHLKKHEWGSEGGIWVPGWSQRNDSNSVLQFHSAEELTEVLF